MVVFELIVLVALFALSFFFSGSETILFSLTAAQRQRIAEHKRIGNCKHLCACQWLIKCLGSCLRLKRGTLRAIGYIRRIKAPLGG